MGEVAWLRGEEKDGTEECYHGDGRTNEQVNIYILFFNVFLHNLVFVFVLGQK